MKLSFTTWSLTVAKVDGMQTEISVRSTIIREDIQKAVGVDLEKLFVYRTDRRDFY